jgi:antitoxin (DNA-binding transcriptional repressor) of toxin-antitoxin stability system
MKAGGLQIRDTAGSNPALLPNTLSDPALGTLTKFVRETKVSPMKTATVRELRNDFGRLSKWLERGETIEIVKRGKVIADLIPKSAGQRKTFLGACPSPVPLPPDIDDPVDAEWEAMK